MRTLFLFVAALTVSSLVLSADETGRTRVQGKGGQVIIINNGCCDNDGDSGNGQGNVVSVNGKDGVVELGLDDLPDVRAEVDKKIEDAPQDGKQYSRKDGAWEEAAGGIDYSLDEQWTGKRWIDGKKIYQKTVQLSIPSTTNTWVNLAMGIANIDYIVNSDVVLSSPDRTFDQIPLSFGSNITVYYLNGALRYYQTTDRSVLTRSYVTLQYTCTDR